jgi:lysophospholipase L1-like esterase
MTTIVKKLIFSLVACALFLTGAELLLRLAHGWNRNWHDCHRPHPVLGWTLREGWEGKWSWTGGYSRINAQGIRDDKPVGKKRPGERRLLVLGDSVTFGAKVPTDEAFPNRLQQALGDSGVQCRVLNGGVTSYDSAQEADWLEFFGWKLDPDLLAVAFCRNDVCPSNRGNQGRDRPMGRLACWLADHSLLAYKIQRGAWYTEGKLGLATATMQIPAQGVPNPPLSGWPLVEGAYRQIARSAVKRRVRVVLLVYPTLDLLQRRSSDDLSERLQDLGKQLSWQVIDLAPAFATDPASLFLPGDAVHPSAAGYDCAAAYTARLLRERGVLP